MSIIIGISDYWHNCWYLELASGELEQKNSKENTYPLTLSPSLPSSSLSLLSLQEKPVAAYKINKCHVNNKGSLNQQSSSKGQSKNENNNINYENSIARLQENDNEVNQEQQEFERSAGGKEISTINRQTNETSDNKSQPIATTTKRTIAAVRKCETLRKESSKINGVSSITKTRRLVHTIDAISAHYLLRELLEQLTFRSLLAKHLESKSVNQLRLQLVPPEKDIIDYKFNAMISHDIWERIEVEYLMAWLSTLGGGFSALGEHFEHCAETAGKISLKQLSVGMRLGDPFLQARCRLYFSISLIQRGHLRAAKHIVREQYKFAYANRLHDARLVKMCRGIWLRLRYEYAEREALRKSRCKIL